MPFGKNFTGVAKSNTGFSTSEIDTGQIWIDGKAIFRKVVETGTIAIGSNTTAHGISNLGTVIRVMAMYQETGSSSQGSMLGVNGVANGIDVFVDNTDITVSAGGNLAATSHVILEYTKT